MMRLIFVIAVVCAALLDFKSALAGSSAVNRETTVSYCHLVRDPKQHDGKVVRVTAVYRYGYEWSELYCADCIDQKATWVDFDDQFSSSTRASIRRKLGDNGFKGRTVLVTIIGRFEAGGGYGHNGAYSYRLFVTEVVSARILLNDSPVPTALPKRLLTRLRCK